MNIIVTIATAVAAIILVAFFVKKGCKPALSVFVIATASILLFLYGKLAATETPWLIGAILLWVVTTIIVLKTAKENGKIVIPLIIIVAMIIAGIAFLAPKVDTKAQDSSTKEVAMQTVDTSDPNGEWAQLGIDHANNRFVASGIDANTPNEAIAKKLFVAKHDISSLMVYTLQEGLITPEQAAIPDFYLTEDKKYLNDEGKAIWNKLDGRLSGAKNYFADKPSGNVNTSTDGNNIYAGNPEEITGDTKTLVSEQPNGTKTETLTRCGNPVFAGSPGLPIGQTDNPPSGGNGGPPVTPPGDTPKSSNIEDYQRPGTDDTTDSGTGVKSPVDTVTTPAESTPPVVEETATGGGGATDNASNDIGSETGVAAPDTAETVTTPPPAAEPGVNPGSGSNTTDPGNPF